MAERTGIPTIWKLARLFCNTLSRLKPAIVRATGNDPQVDAAIDTALAACAALEIILETFLVPGD